MKKSKVSKWNGVDLHIHSKHSNNVKGNDYKGEEYTGEKLLRTLKSSGISIFSVTDHNSINTKLYENIREELKKEEFKEMGYVVGAELDIFDTDIYTKVFHILILFDVEDSINSDGTETKDYEIAEKVINDIFKGKRDSERNSKDIFPSVKDVFNSLTKFKIRDVLLIPHYNNKEKGLQPGNALKHLKYLCFNAFEDGNNVAKIKESLNKYLSSGSDNFPFAVFSDCHNLNIYPYNRDKEKEIPPAKCSMLSNVDYPFNSVKTAFEESRLRISIEGVSGMRSTSIDHSYISKILINGYAIELSPYQNTIIGKFGSGKSLIMEKLKKGNDSLKEHNKYKLLYDKTDKFNVFLNDNKVNSLEEGIASDSNLVNYDFLQQEDYYYSNNLTYEQINSLLPRLNIERDFSKLLPKLEIKDTISIKLTELLNNINKTNIINNFNYENAFDEEKYYNLILDEKAVGNFDNIIEEINKNKEDIGNLATREIHGIKIFNKTESVLINELINVLLNKANLLKITKDQEFENILYSKMGKYNGEYVNNKSKETLNKFNQDFKKFTRILEETNEVVRNFEKTYNENVFKDISTKRLEPINDAIKVEYSYKHDNVEYKPLSKHNFSGRLDYNDFYKNWLNSCLNGGLLRDRKSLGYIGQYIEKYVNEINALTEVNDSQYDIYYLNESVLQKSPGEKSSIFITMVFELIEEDLRKGISVILTLDQPEDNIDNDNTYKLIANKIRELKVNYSNFQLIIVTHNANVGIAADSENIIIANGAKFGSSEFTYLSGSIEDRNHIDHVCQILEGGLEALKSRTVKYGVNIIRKG